MQVDRCASNICSYIFCEQDCWCGPLNGGMALRVNRAETASRFEASNWAAVSGLALFGKAYPVLSRYSGSQFPLGVPTGKRVPEFDQIVGRAFRQVMAKGLPPCCTRLAMLRNRFFESGMKILDSYI